MGDIITQGASRCTLPREHHEAGARSMGCLPTQLKSHCNTQGVQVSPGEDRYEKEETCLPYMQVIVLEEYI